MSQQNNQSDSKGLARAGMCLLGTAALMLPAATPADAKPGFIP